MPWWRWPRLPQRGSGLTWPGDRSPAFPQAGPWATRSGPVSAIERSVDGGRIRQFTADELFALSRGFGLPIGFFLTPPGDDPRHVRIATPDSRKQGGVEGAAESYPDPVDGSRPHREIATTTTSSPLQTSRTPTGFCRATPTCSPSLTAIGAS